jgi:ribokinase
MNDRPPKPGGVRETDRRRFAVVGHVEWVDFLEVERVPVAGEIVNAAERWSEAAGGGAVAVVQLVKLAGTAAFFTALGDDELAHRAATHLRGHGVDLLAAIQDRPQRRAVTFLDARGERTITTVGRRLVPRAADRLPWDRLAEMDGVYFTGGDVGALRAARNARMLVATPRARDALDGSGVTLDAFVRSGSDRGEQDDPERLGYFAEAIVTTHGAEGVTYSTAKGTSGSVDAPRLGGPVVDAYGAGDSFAAGLTFGLGSGFDIESALAVAVRCGAGNLMARGPYAGQPHAEALNLPRSNPKPG